MKIRKSRDIRALAAMAAAALCLTTLTPAQAQTADWPNKPLRLLVGSAPWRRHRRHGARRG
jgi:hypothetical protein